MLLVLSLAGCGAPPEKTSPMDSIKTYKDIPGVTEEEIAAIEAVKADRGRLTYGSLLSTEAFILPDGSFAGFAIAYGDFLTGLFGIPFVPEMYEWDELIKRLDTQALDFTGELTATAERAQKYSMSHSIAERVLRIFTLADSNIRTESDIEGLTLGFLEDTVTADSIAKAYPMAFERVSVDNYHTAARLLQEGEIDAFVEEAVADPAFTEYDFIHSAIFFSMVHESVSMTTANPDLLPFISVVDKYISSGGADVLYALYKEGDFAYAKHKLHRSFTEEERAYLEDLAQQGKTVFVAYERDNYPVVFFNEVVGQFEGIAVDVLAEISGLTGIRFEAVAPKGAIWADLLQGVHTGEIPMVAQLLYSKSRSDHFLWSTVPYSHSYYAILSKADFPNLASYQVMRERVGVMRQSGHAEIYRELFPDNDNLVEYDGFTDCLDALERGEVTLLMASEHMLLNQINYRGRPGFKINIKLNAPMNSHFGFHKEQKVLHSIIDKAQQHVPTDAIEISWTGRLFDYSKKLAEERALYMSIFMGVLLLILVATMFLLIKNVRLSKKLEEIANHDALTGIYNRRFFLEFAEMQISRSNRTGIDCFAIMFDLDHFKAVNDTYGHLAGDMVLKEIARRVKKAIRPYDIFGRYGGEEFLILMTDVKPNNKTNTMNTTERIRLEVCKTPVVFEGIEIPVTASFGISFAAPRNNLETAIRYADEALYQAKEGGRNRVAFYDDGEKDDAEP